MISTFLSANVTGVHEQSCNLLTPTREWMYPNIAVSFHLHGLSRLHLWLLCKTFPLQFVWHEVTNSQLLLSFDWIVAKWRMWGNLKVTACLFPSFLCKYFMCLMTRVTIVFDAIVWCMILYTPCSFICVDSVLCSSCSYCTFTVNLPIIHSASDPSDLWWKDSGARAWRDPSLWRLTTWPSSPLAWIKDPQSPLCSFTIAPCARPPTSMLPWQLTTVRFICWGGSLCYTIIKWVWGSPRCGHIV